MDWFLALFHGPSPAQTFFVLSLVIAVGLAVGNLKIYNIKLGIAGVLFAGILFGHYQITIHNEEVLHFIREFGLILFVYAIGLQVGPSFFNALYQQGLRLVSLAVAIVLAGAGITVAVFYLAEVPAPVAVGLLAGATTNTPSLAAAQQALMNASGAPPDGANSAALAYAIAYPFGIMGIIVSMTVVRLVFRVSPPEEAEKFKQDQKATTSRPEYQDLDIENNNLEGISLREISYLEQQGLVVTRVFHDDKVEIAQPSTILHVGDTVRVVGPREKLGALHLLFGQPTEKDLKELPTNLRSRRIVVTRKKCVGITTQEIRHTYNAIVSRVGRPDVEFTPSNFLRIQYGDQLTVVGEDGDLDRLAKDLGNSLEQLNYPEILPIFIGITLGVLLGSVPFNVPGAAAPIKLGLAGGPLLVAIFLSAKGTLGPISLHLPKSSNIILREVGIVLFLSAVGLSAGHQFVTTILEGNGLQWFLLAAVITVAPLLLIGLVARGVYKLNYMSICGLLAGSMTDPPALAFANSITVSNAPSIAYATVYPFVMILRIICAQILVQLFL